MSEAQAQEGPARPNALIAMIRLTRPGNVAIAALAVLVGSATGPHPLVLSAQLGWAALVASVITAGGNVLNDVADIGVDRLNKPWRALPSRAIGARGATIWAGTLLAIGIGASLPLSVPCRWIALFAVGAVILYDLWGKGRPFIGNFLVAFVSALVFVFGSLAVGAGLWGLIPAGIAFFFHLAREIIKDLEDLDADRQGGLRTLPLVAGEAVARRMTNVILVLLILALPVPFLADWLGMAYLVVAVAGVGAPAAYLIWSLRSQRAPEVYGRLARLLKWDMLVGLAAVLVG